MTMKTPSKRILMASAAALVVLGLGTATVAGVAHARGWDNGPGSYGQGGGPGMMQQRQGDPGMMRHGGQRGPGMDGPGGGPLAMIDTDQDGTLTRTEFETFHALAFKAMDTDGDGQVTRQAFLDARAANPQGGGPRSGWRAERYAERLGQRFDAWDGDGDGVVTDSEFSAQAQTRFQAMDLDGDDQVTAQETAATRMFGPRGPGMGPIDE